MTLVEIRYYFEHKILPQYYFEDTELFLSEILDTLNNEEDAGENIVYDLIYEMAQKNDIEFPYSRNEYKAELFSLNEDNYMIRICLPEPEEPLLCSYIYMMFYTEDLSKIRYFTVELLEKKKRKNLYCLCEWEQNGFHKNYIRHHLFQKLSQNPHFHKL